MAWALQVTAGRTPSIGAHAPRPQAPDARQAPVPGRGLQVEQGADAELLVDAARQPGADPRDRLEHVLGRVLAAVERGVTYRVAAKTMDDAAGEALDRIAAAAPVERKFDRPVRPPAAHRRIMPGCPRPWFLGPEAILRAVCSMVTRLLSSAL